MDLTYENMAGAAPTEKYDDLLDSNYSGGSFLDRVSASYQGIHGYVSTSVCVFGIISNLMNIVVLTRRSMITPTNCLLTALAISDLLTMVVYLPYVMYFHCVTLPAGTYPHPWGWIVYLLFNSYFTITAHTVSMWLTVALAMFRYIAVCHHVHAITMCSLSRARLTILSIVVSTPLFCIPNYVLYRPVILDTGSYWFEENAFVSSFHRTFNYWLFGVVLKVIPCILLVVLSALLLNAMKTANTRRRSLVGHRSSGGGVSGSDAGTERDSREYNRTTCMLVAVVLFFVATEFPQGLLALLSGIDQRVFDHVYVPLGDIWDVVAIINSAVNFILYCTMSRQFRTTFREVFCGAQGGGSREWCCFWLCRRRSQVQIHSCEADIQMPLFASICGARRSPRSLSSWVQYETRPRNKHQIAAV